MPLHSSAALIAEVGTAITKLTLVDLVDDEYRLIARAETSSTLTPPEADLTIAVVRLAGMLEAITGRELVRNGQLLVGPDAPGGGVGGIVVTTSAGGSMRAVVAALAAQQSAREAVNAARGTYARIEHVFSVDAAGEADTQWLGHEVAQLAGAQPEVVVIAGGLEGGAAATLERIGQIVGLVVRRSPTPPLVIYTGNSAAAGVVTAAIGDGVEVRQVENLRPTIGINRLEPTRSILRQMYNEQHLPKIAGYEKLKVWRPGHIGTVAEDQALIVRFLAERFGRNILALDAGATHCVGLIQAEEHFSQAVLANGGLGVGALQLLDTAGAEAIARWLPFELSEADLQNRLLNRLLRPNVPPANLDELLIDHALLREALRGVVDALAQARTNLRYDLVIAGGAVARAPRPGLVALVLLDSLPLEQDSSRFAIDLYVDSLSLLPVAGALAHVDADAAACLMERDGLNNGPLATVVVPQGTITEGSPVIEVELKTSQGDVKNVTVEGGQIVRLELPRGQRGTLRIRPAQGVYIGDNAPGAEVLSDEAAIAGSALGIVIDARPRPLVLPQQSEERGHRILAWLKALDALPPARTGDPAAPWQLCETTPEVSSYSSTPAAPALAPEEVPMLAASTATIAAGSGTPEGEPTVVQMASTEADHASVGADEEPDDIQSMRASLVEQTKPKRGFFRRS